MADPPKIPQIPDPNLYCNTNIDDILWEMIEDEIMEDALTGSTYQQALQLVQLYFQSQRQSRPSSSRRSKKRRRRRVASLEGSRGSKKHYQQPQVEVREAHIEENPIQTGIVPIQSDTFKLGFIGCGNVAEFIVRGVVNSGVLPPSRIRASHVVARHRCEFESIGVTIFEQDHQVVEECDVVIFCVGSKIVKDVLLQLRQKLSEKQLLVSIVTGTQLKDLEEWAGHRRFIRVMPNTLGEGEATSVMSLGGAATNKDGELIEGLFGAIGKVSRADEKLFDAIAGRSRSGSVCTYLAIEALADGGVAAGLPLNLAMSLASQTS